MPSESGRPVANAPEERPRAEEPQQPPHALERREIGGPKGPEPTRYGDWERAGRCIDF
jgi:hypothetical protein